MVSETNFHKFSYLMRRHLLDDSYSIGKYRFFNNKVIAKNFVKSLAFKATNQLKVFTALSDLKLTNNIVIKPSFEAWSNGVFLIKNEKLIINLTDNSYLFSFDQVKAEAQNLLERRIVKTDLWNVEELITGPDSLFPANEIKFYCFYGKVELIMKKRFNHQQNEYLKIYLTKDLKIIASYETDKSFIEPGLPKEYFLAAEKISETIPLPFIRIDFHESSNGLVFNEFEILPGIFKKDAKHSVMPEHLIPEYDLKLGTYFLDAEKRLANDIKNGKIFLTDKELMAYAIKF